MGYGNVCFCSIEGVSPTRQQISGRKPGPSAGMDDNGFFITSPNKYNLNANAFISISPLKNEPVAFSPFKDSSLSPFKHYNQSPSKGSFDDWDKDFIASFEEKLFGIGDLSENTVEELLKSPKGKALLERGRQTQGMSPGQTFRISPRRRLANKGNLFIGGESVTGKVNATEVIVKQEPAETFVIKQENVEGDHMYGQTYVYVNSNGTLSAIDPDKMSATPIKPRPTQVENPPKRKLTMKAPAPNPVQTILFQSQPTPQPVQTNEQTVWPSKERLNFARAHFRKVLDNAVEKERQILRDLEVKTGKNSNIPEAKPVGREKSGKHMKTTGGKTKKSTGGKGKSRGKKGTKKERYPEISMALSKPVHSTSGKRSRTMSHQFADSPTNFENFNVYLDNDEEEVEVEWGDRPQFYSQMSTGFDAYLHEETSDEEWTVSGYRYNTGGGKRVKKRKR